MPDLSSSSSSSGSSEHSDSEDKKISDNQTKAINTKNDKKKETSYANPSFDPRHVYHADDDAQVCSIVPIKDRKVMFEQIQAAEVVSGEEEKTRGGKIRYS